VEVDDTMLAFFGFNRENAPPFFKGEGCDRCSGNGYRGRVAIYEVLVMNDELKRAVAAGAKTDALRDMAEKGGMINLKEYAMFLMEKGLTTVEEVLTNLVISD
jgi:type IV pilus assembly protein PilB